MAIPASLSIDLDNLWTYMRAHGIEGWQECPSYYERIIPQIIDLTENLGVKITAFAIGKDAENPANAEWLRKLVEHGHEVGNHSYWHEPWLHTYTDEELDADVASAEEAILAATGVRPTGFRGPGFSTSVSLLGVLKSRGYDYDASEFPTIIGPLLRRVYFASAELSEEERRIRSKQFGSLSNGFKPNRPYVWRLDDGDLVELPVTTMPLTRLPIHFTYLHYAAAISPPLANLYFSIAAGLCRLTRCRPSFLLHPLDFLAADAVPELAMFPGIGNDTAAKSAATIRWVEKLARSFDLKPVAALADAERATGRLSSRTPRALAS